MAPNRGRYAPVRVLEVVDNGALGISGSERHKKVIDALLPKPVRFKLIWEKLRGKRPLFVWAPVPPNRDYVALGHVTTTDANAPPLDAVRCVPIQWCQKAGQPKKLWDDAGTSGRQGSLWIVNSLGLIAASDGHDPPQGTFYDLQCRSFLCTSDLRIVPDGDVD